MADKGPIDAFAIWLPVIGKALAYLCLREAQRADPTKLETVVNQVEFLEGLGLSTKDAAETVGSTEKSVRVMRRRKKTRAKRGTTKEKIARGH